MKKKNLLKIGLTLLFILLAGICYSCRRTINQNPILSLQSQDSKDTLINQESPLLLLEPNSSEIMSNTDSNAVSNTESMKDTIVVPEDPLIYIHICGAIKEPNVYEVKQGTRLIEVIKLAGGLMEEAAGEYVNQASLLEDGEQIYIPTKDEVEGMTLTEYIGKESGKVSNPDSIGKVNINTATLEELMTLTGIGESKAKSILTYRQANNRFDSIEDIMNIDGIKDSIFNKICDLITVD